MLNTKTTNHVNLIYFKQSANLYIYRANINLKLLFVLKIHKFKWCLLNKIEARQNKILGLKRLKHSLQIHIHASQILGLEIVESTSKILA